MICAAAKFDRVQAGGTEAVELHAGHAVAITGDQRGRAGDIGASFADRIDAAQNHVVDQRRIQIVAVLDGAERLAGEIERGDLVQRAVGLAAAARGTDMIVNEGVGHDISSPGGPLPSNEGGDWPSVGPDVVPI